MQTERIGSKAKNLIELQRLGCRVPSFLALSNKALLELCILEEQISLNQEVWYVLKKRIEQEIQGDRYAVRSAALIEDQSSASFAGQFKTVTDASLDGVEEAIVEVVSHAREYLEGDLFKFSLIIQTYIDPEYAGVVFTRHPEGRRSMLIEYHHGKGEELVSGQVIPESVELLWSERPHLKNLPSFLEVFDQVKLIEEHFGHPQDIEWCVHNGEWYFLQTRPITTIDDEQYRGIQFLENSLPQSHPFLYEQTEISEVVPRPGVFMQSLLKRIYAQGGPVDQVYQGFGITYSERDFLKVIGNQLYVDREEELKTLFPNYTYFAVGHVGTPHMQGLKGFWKSIHQQGMFKKLSDVPISALEQRLHAHLSLSSAGYTLEEALSRFLDVYKTIFEVNLLAEEAIRNAQKHEPTFSLDRSSKHLVQGDALLPPPESVTWKGNSLDMADQSAFVAVPLSQLMLSGNDRLDRADRLIQLREQGRWLTVKMINALRGALFATSYGYASEKKEDLFFASIDEIQQDRVEVKTCHARMKEYHVFDTFSFPSELASFCRKKVGDVPLCLSKGVGEGVLVRLDQMSQVSGPKVLYVETLTPDLVHAFSDVQAILTRRGGVLSHLAILAREYGLPVLSNIDLRKQGVQLGDRVNVDAERQRITLG